MAVDYTIIFQTRQWFGDRSSAGDDHITKYGDWTQTQYVGVSKDYNFPCPNINPAQEAVLQFQAQGVETTNILRINGQDIFGGLTAAVFDDRIKFNGKGVAVWSTYSLIVHKYVLSTNNILHIESVANPNTGKYDDFIVDNVVLFYKTLG